ncbi:glycerol kinase GlpK [Chryseolinea sp. T2]|uniref:FGGY family carbohydrate kinase n=1 Tax=Chryseolinea sp. T2 TaxID=3129255 RepID=UPI00307713F5
MKYILAIDQGTSSTKTILFDENGRAFAKGTEPLKTNYLPNGFVEQDPEEIFKNVLTSVEQCLADFKSRGGNAADIRTCGISNQRETFVIWDEHGVPLCNALVWQCKRSVAICERLKAQGHEPAIRSSTGLLLDPYFSGTKLCWLYENIPEVKEAINAGKAYFGTVDTWVLFKLTHGANYYTDYTNASRTLFFNLNKLAWDHDLLDLFGVSKLNLPKPKPSSSLFGESDFNGLLPSRIEITALIGDSHAAAFGEGCFNAGTAKATLGTGCSVMMSVGDKVTRSNTGMVSTICWSTETEVQYALEGVIVTCGGTIEWLRNELQLFTDSKQTEAMAKAVSDNGGVYIIPGFSGLGAPHWQMSRRGEIKGLTFGSTKNHLVRAALESIPYQIKDVIAAMESDTSISLQQLMIDGGISSNQFIVNFLAELLGKPVVNIGIADVSALGAAYLAGLHCKIFRDLNHLTELNSEKTTVRPSGDQNVKKWYKGWQHALAH